MADEQKVDIVQRSIRGHIPVIDELAGSDLLPALSLPRREIEVSALSSSLGPNFQGRTIPSRSSGPFHFRASDVSKLLSQERPMSFLRTAAFAASLALALSACVPAGLTPPSDDRSLLPQRGRVAGELVFGSSLGPFSSLNDDCTVQSHARVRILQPPQNGVARVALRRGVASFTANNSFARCNGSPITGTYVDYTPRDGFVGTDRFRIEIVFADGERRVLAPELTVRPRP
jgi:hypothetical protein